MNTSTDEGIFVATRNKDIAAKLGTPTDDSPSAFCISSLIIPVRLDALHACVTL